MRGRGESEQRSVFPILTHEARDTWEDSVSRIRIRFGGYEWHVERVGVSEINANERVVPTKREKGSLLAGRPRKSTGMRNEITWYNRSGLRIKK